MKPKLWTINQSCGTVNQSCGTAANQSCRPYSKESHLHVPLHCYFWHSKLSTCLCCRGVRHAWHTVVAGLLTEAVCSTGRAEIKAACCVQLAQPSPLSKWQHITQKCMHRAYRPTSGPLMAYTYLGPQLGTTRSRFLSAFHLSNSIRAFSNPGGYSTSRAVSWLSSFQC